MKPDGSGTYTAQHTFTVKERAVIRLDKGFFDFAVKEHGFVFVDNGGKVEITGEGKVCVNKDGHVCLLGASRLRDIRLCGRQGASGISHGFSGEMGWQ